MGYEIDIGLKSGQDITLFMGGIQVAWARIVRARRLEWLPLFEPYNEIEGCHLPEIIRELRIVRDEMSRPQPPPGWLARCFSRRPNPGAWTDLERLDYLLDALSALNPADVTSIAISD